jgi:hypothetical protein
MKTTVKIKPYRMIIGAVITLIVLLACSLASQQPTPTLIPTEIPPTPTQAPTDTLVPTATLAPTDTPLPTDTPVPPTNTPRPTKTATPNRTATAAVYATQESARLIATINPILAKYDFSTDQGQLGWLQEEPLPLYTYEYGTTVYYILDREKAFSNYVLKVDVGWESTSGLAGCGVIFHAEDNWDVGQQYRFFTTRLSGLPAWDVEFWQYGDYQSNATGRVKTNAAIKQGAGDVNTYVIIAQDKMVSLYVNNSRLGNVSISKRQSGLIAFFTWQESGETTCTFSNGWIWELK